MLAAVAVCGVCTALLLPGGYLIHLPLLAVLVLTVLVARLLCQLRAHRNTFRLWEYFRLSVAVLLLIGAVCVYAPFFGYATMKLEHKQFAAVQRRRALNIQAPERVRHAALALHAELVNLPLGHRSIAGSSERLPPEIASLAPLAVCAHDDYLFVEMCRNSENWIGLVIFTDSAVEDGDIKLGDRVWFWETP